MFVRDAKGLCPQLVILSYDFQAYEEVADKFYDILHKHCKKVQAVSCDEAFLDATDSGVEDIQAFVHLIRKEIVESTGCTASAGIARNMLLARLATRTAKPDGQCCIPPEKVKEYLHDLPVKALPGIGHVLEEKLKKRLVTTCGQLRMIPKESLQKDFGLKTGNMLWNYSRGIDTRLVGLAQENKSIGADVNGGVRFKDLKDIKKRKIDAGEPAKYLGCGICDNLSHSTTVAMATDDVDVLYRIASQLFGHFQIDVEDIRGMGFQVTKLEMAFNTKQGNEKNSIHAWLSSTMTNDSNRPKSNQSKSADTGNGNQSVDEDTTHLASFLVGPLVQSNTRPSTSNVGNRQDAGLPPMHDLDVGVIDSLPPELLSEINEIYNGELLNFISERKNIRADICHKSLDGTLSKEKTRSSSCLGSSDNLENAPADSCSGAASSLEKSNMNINGCSDVEACIMPSSLSLVDTSVLQQLPEELKVDILQNLPAHRTCESPSHASLKYDNIQNNQLWVGDQPKWIDKFKASNCKTLNVLAHIFCESRPNNMLSLVLQKIMCEICVIEDADDTWCNAVSSMCELVKQYVELKVETDIEEVYVCACLLRRLTATSKVFCEVYNSLLPYLQARVSETYGGSLPLSHVKD